MKKMILIAAAAALVGLSAQAQIAITDGGGQAAAPLISGSPSGAPTLGTAFSNGAQAGNLSTWVIVGNMFGAADLTFVYQVSESGSTFVQNLSLDGYNGITSVDVAYSTTGLVPATTIAPENASLSSGVITWDFPDTAGNELVHGDNSAYLYVITTATAYAQSTGNVNDGVTASSGILAPVPEANTVVAGALMLLPLGIGAVRALRKERTA